MSTLSRPDSRLVMNAKTPFKDTQSLQGSKILVVDDSVTLRKRILEFMSLEGFVTQEASRGAEVIPLAKKFLPDLILMDVIMPDCDGIELCKELRTFQQFEKVPILMLTVKGSAYDVSEAFKAGANDYVRKPFGAEELLLRIRVHLHTMKLLKQLEEATDTIGKYMGLTAYEIRTPLMNILGLAEVLNQESVSKNAETNFLFKNLLTEGERLVSMVNSMLEISDLGFGKMVLSKEAVDLDLFLPEVVRKAVSLGRHRQIELTLDCSLEHSEVFMDAEKIQQALDNLFFNALDSSPQPGEVTIRARSTEDGVRIEVQDQGPGITAEDKNNIFDPFFRDSLTGHSSSRGVGLGLGITRRIIDKHNGTMGVDNNAQGGAIFYITLPYA